MTGNLYSSMVIVLVAGLWVLVIVSMIVRVVKRNRGPVKTVKAVVSDKHKLEVFSAYSGAGTREKYVVVFSAQGKKLSFYVSEFSYNGYQIGEKGTLKYAGDRLIEFTEG